MLSKMIVKYIQSLDHKKLRDEQGVFLAEGPKVVEELLMSGKLFCKIICGVAEWMNNNEVLLKRSSVESKIEILPQDLEKISLLKTPNKVVAVFYKKEDDENYVLQKRISLMLDDIQDPGNLGTIIRIADWFGITNIICSNGCADYYNPKVIQSSMGSVARVNIIYRHLENFLQANASIPLYAATLQGHSIYTNNKPDEAIVLIGNESKGVSENLIHLSSNQITIPRFGKAESLNAAVACGIILSHLVK